MGGERGSKKVKRRKGKDKCGEGRRRTVGETGKGK